MNLRKFILDALRKKFEGVDEKVLNRIARNAAKTVKSEEEATQFVEDYTIQQVIDSYTDSRVTESISSYEKKHGLKDGKPATTDDDPDDVEGNKDPDKDKKGKKEDDDPDEDGKDKGKKGNDDMPSWARALIEGQTRLNERLDGIEKGKAADARKSKFMETIKDAPEKFRKRAEKKFARYTFKDDEDFEEYLEELAEEVEEASTTEQSKGGIVTPPKGGSKGGGKDYQPSAAMKARAERNKAEVTTSAIQGLPTANTNN